MAYADITDEDKLVWDTPTGAVLVCKKSVVMTDDQVEAFTAGKEYTVDSMHPIAEPAYIRLTNNQGESHMLNGEHIRQFFRRRHEKE